MDAELDEMVQHHQSLRRVEAMLKERLVPPSEDKPADLGAGLIGSHTSALGLAKEIFVRPSRWYSGGAGTVSSEVADEADEAQHVLYLI